MKTILILAALCLFSPFLLKAQQAIKPTAQPDSIIKIVPLEAVDEVVYAYTIGGKLQTRADVVIKLLVFAPSAEEYHKSKNNFTWSWISAGAFGASSFASVIDFHNAGKNTVATMGAVHNNSGAYIFAGIATAFAASAIINWVEGFKHFKKSIKVYNQHFE